MSLTHYDTLGWGFLVVCCALSLTTYAFGEIAVGMSGNAAAKRPWDVLATILLFAGLFLPF